MTSVHVKEMRKAHKTILEIPFDVIELRGGYTGRIMRIDLDHNSIEFQEVSQQMKDLWVGGKGFDLWLMFQEIKDKKKTDWDSNHNPICFSSGPLGGTTSFPGSGKTLITSISPLTHIVIDSNVGGYFGPYMKFAGFDAITIVGKAKNEIIILIDAVAGKILIEEAPKESIDSHILAEELTEMYADNEDDKRNIAVVSAGQAADHTYFGILNFSFYDWRRKVTRLKQAGRGGIGTVFRDKKLKGLVIKNRQMTPEWSIAENKHQKEFYKSEPTIIKDEDKIKQIEQIVTKWKNNPDYVIEMMLEIQECQNHISKTAIDIIAGRTGKPKAYLYHIATFYKVFSLEQKGEKTIQVCTGAACQAKGAGIILETLERNLGIKAGETTPDKKYTLEAASCLGACEIAPVIKIDNELIGKVDPKNIPELLKNGIKASDNQENDVITCVGIPEALVLRKRNEKYLTIKKIINNKESAENIIDRIKESGLKGRGGGGFPTGRKWEICRNATIRNEIKSQLICNSSIIEPSPDSVVEGLLIAAIAVDADNAQVCFRHEHLAAMKRFETELEFARKEGLLGKDALGEGRDFEIVTRRGAGGYVIGESSALLQTISGKTGEPQSRYIHQAETGYKKKPTLVQNTETWANIPLMFENCQTCCSAKTKAVLLSGDIRKGGVYEVKLGIPLKDIIDACGNIAGKKRTLKALQIGGPGGGFIPANMLDLPYHYDTLASAGTYIGASSIVVKDNRKCIVDSVKYSLDFLLDESCGKCTPCREGLYALKTIFTRISKGEGNESDLEMIGEIAETLSEASFCNFGTTAAAPVLSALKYFKDEIEEHIKDKKCRSGVCKDMVTYSINKDKCTGCTLCARKCPVNAITGENKKSHSIAQDKCIKCGICFDTCNFDAVEVK